MATRVDLKYMKYLTDLNEGNRGSLPGPTKLLKRRHSENTTEGPRMRTRVNLEKIRLLMQKAYKERVNKDKVFSINILGTKQSKVSMHKYWAMFDRIMHSQWAVKDTLPAQLGVVLAILCETRQLILDFYDMGKVRGAKAEKIKSELEWMNEPFQMLETMLNEFFYEYGSQRSSKVIVEETDENGNVISSANVPEMKKKQHRRHRSYIGVGQNQDDVDQEKAAIDAINEDADADADAENVSENSAPLKQSDSVKTINISVLPNEEEESSPDDFKNALELKCLIEAPLVFLQERVHRLSADDKKLLFEICPNVKNLTAQVVHFVEQGYDDIVVSLYIAETVGKALMTVFIKTEYRHKFYSSLLQVYSCARGISWAALAFNRDTDLFAYKTASDDDLDRMCRKNSQI